MQVKDGFVAAAFLTLAVAVAQVSARATPQTYRLDGRQYLLTAAGDTLYAFTLY